MFSTDRPIMQHPVYIPSSARPLHSRRSFAAIVEIAPIFTKSVIAYASHVLIREKAANGIALYRSPLLAAIGVKHAFSTRIGGVSPPPFDSLNLGNLAGDVRDDPAHVAENLNKFHLAAGLADRRRAWVHQVHGNRVAIVSDASFENGMQADALVTSDADAALLVRIADCVPVLLSSDDAKTVAAIHAGWRGVVAGVVPRAALAVANLAKIPANRIIAAIGPCISRDYFEVGPEVIAEFVSLFGPSPRWADRHVDLAEAVAAQLRASGVLPAQIDRTDRCSARDRDEFFSHRRDRGITGRMAAVIAPADEPFHT
jgi:YfiH family protein